MAHRRAGACGGAFSASSGVSDVPIMSDFNKEYSTMRLPIAAGLIAAATALLGAQSSSQQSPAATAQPPAPKPVTVTGCLQAGSDQSTFTLTTADTTGATGTNERGAPPERATGTTGTREGGAPQPEIKTVTYVLTAQNTVDLKPHVGHTVHDTGTAPAAQDEVS